MGKIYKNIRQIAEKHRALLPQVQTARTVLHSTVNIAANSGNTCPNLGVILNAYDRGFWEFTDFRDRFFYIFSVPGREPDKHSLCSGCAQRSFTGLYWYSISTTTCVLSSNVVLLYVRSSNGKSSL